MGFQTACAMLQLVRADEEYPNWSKFRVEGENEKVDFEILDSADRPLLLAQAKTRVEPEGWGAAEILSIARQLDNEDPTGRARIQFISDAPANSTGKRLKELASQARGHSDPQRWLSAIRSIVPAGIQVGVGDHDLFARLEIHTRRGPWNLILDQVKMQILKLLGTARQASEVEEIANRLFVELFAKSGDSSLLRRTVGREFLTDVLGLSVVQGSTTSPPAARDSKAIFRNVPIFPHVYGRLNEMKAIRDHFGSADDANPKTFALCGLGGIGKSSIAGKFIAENGADYGLVWWITADSAGGILTAYRDFADESGASARLSEHALLSWVSQHLSGSYSKVLIVYDNCTDKRAVYRLLPQCGNAHFLITTRDSTWLSDAPGISVGKLREDEALAWCLERLPGIPESDCKTLLDAVERIPLAMAQASSYIMTTGCPVPAYIAELQRRRVELLDDSETIPLQYDQQKTLIATILMSVEVLLSGSAPGGQDAKKTALEILGRCSLLSPSGIPLYLAALGLQSESAIYAGIRELKKLSLVEIHSGLLSMHRIVQEVVRSVSASDSIETFLEAFQFVLAEQLAEGISARRWNLVHPLIEHAYHVAGNIQHLATPTVDTVALLANTANAFGILYGDFGRAKTLLRRALDILGNISARDKEYRLAATLVGLAEVSYNAREHAEALAIATEGRSILERKESLAEEERRMLLRAYLVEMNASVALGSTAEAGRASLRAHTLLAKYDFDLTTRLHALLEQAQAAVWIGSMEAAKQRLDDAYALNPAGLDPSGEVVRRLDCLKATVQAATGHIEDALTTQARIAPLLPDTPAPIRQRYADDLLELVHAITSECIRRWSKELGGHDWPMHACRQILKLVDRILSDLPEPDSTSLGLLHFRGAVINIVLYEVGRDVSLLQEATHALRDAISFFRVRPRENIRFQELATELLSACENCISEGGSVLARDDGNDRPELEKNCLFDPDHPAVLALPGNYPDSPSLSGFGWRQVLMMGGRVPEEARFIYAAWATMRFYLSGRRTPAQPLVCKCMAIVLGMAGYSVRVIPVRALIMTSGMEVVCEAGSGLLPPFLDERNGLVGHAVLWIENMGRIMDPIIGFAGIDPARSGLADVLRVPIVAPVNTLSDFTSNTLAFPRGDYLIAYKSDVRRESQLSRLLESQWSNDWEEFAQLVHRDALRLLEVWAAQPHI